MRHGHVALVLRIPLRLLPEAAANSGRQDSGAGLQSGAVHARVRAHRVLQPCQRHHETIERSGHPVLVDAEVMAATASPPPLSDAATLPAELFQCLAGLLEQL